MMDLERLDEAFNELERYYDTAALRELAEWCHRGDLSNPLTVALEAARAYRDLLANGERVEWCEEHESLRGSPEGCQMAMLASWLLYADCRIVSKLLVDYPTEEE